MDIKLLLVFSVLGKKIILIGGIMWVIVGLFGVAGLILGFWTATSIVSDIQLILMFVGLFGGMALLALSDLLARGSDIEKRLRELDARHKEDVAERDAHMRRTAPPLLTAPRRDFNTALDAYRKTQGGEDHAVAIKKLATERLESLGFLKA